jgi:7-keto-8-aminopelargonate synthetase-like enzyme
VPHHDADAFDTRLRQWHKACGHGRAWIAVESLYSMGGDSPDLTDLLAVASRHYAILVIDEAHATGVLGADAALRRRDNVITLHTWGKALGHVGRLCAGAEDRARLSGQPGAALHLRDRPLALDRGRHTHGAADFTGKAATPGTACASGHL